MGILLDLVMFLIQITFNLIIDIIWLRILLRFFCAYQGNVIYRAINSITNFVLYPIEKLIYGKYLPITQYDWLGFAVLVVIELTKFIVIGLAILKTIMPLNYLVIFIMADLIIRPCNILFYLILIRVVVSWVNPTLQNPAIELIKTVTNPLWRLGHKIIPNISGFDFAPIILVVILKIITLFINSLLPIHL